MATQKESAEHIDINDRHLRRLQKSGVLPVSKGKGGLNLDQVRMSYISYLRGLSQNSKNADTSLEKEKTRLTKAQANKVEFEYEILEGKYLSEESVRDVWSVIFSNVKSKILSLPTKASKKVLGFDNLEEIEEILTKEVYEILEELKEYKKEDYQK
ncbi:MAG: hypothetical protein COB02_13730 [Candidatus Cloacimonadota bacterium]|nr:MAG: hypothetical protein COB02_13730 [Candidatus Cloacimonadota bacterium]